MCFKCGSTLNISYPISRSEVCPKCGSDVRCCKNCNHYFKGAHYDCHETVDELIVEKERANFCDWFSLKTKTGNDTNNYGKKIDAKAQFNSLFGD